MKAFSVFLQDLRDGRAHAELSEQLDHLISKVRETHKGGSLKLTLKIKPASRGDVDKVVIADHISVELPQPERGEDFFWLTDDNDLTRNHPKQQSLELREVPITQPTQFKEATK